MISNRMRDEGEHRFRDEAEQFQADPVTAFGFAGMISMVPALRKVAPIASRAGTRFTDW